jgi:predicted GNAT family acetyltransferase
MDNRAMSAVEYTVRDNPTELRYEILDGDELLGLIRYVKEPGAVVLVHTEVEPKAEGHGVGTRLVEGTLADMRARGLKLVPVCPFVRAYLEQHPEWDDLVVANPRHPD